MSDLSWCMTVNSVVKELAKSDSEVGRISALLAKTDGYKSARKQWNAGATSRVVVGQLQRGLQEMEP